MSPTNALRRVLDLLAFERHLGPLEHRARRVERVGRDAEHDPGAVRLARVLEVAQQPGRAAESDEQHAGRVGIERARVPDPALAVELAHAARRRRATCAPPACRPPPVRRARARR